MANREPQNMTSKKITICTCRTRHLTDSKKVEELVKQANDEGLEVNLVDDLCALFEDNDPSIVPIAEGTIAACHERAVRSLLEWRGYNAAKIINIRTQEPTRAEGPLSDAWFPIIDKSRCSECGKCFDFCPFNVYEMVDGRVRVTHPHRCKNNCPACARNCPSEAIIFPKHEYSPINGGTAQEEDAIRVDHSTLYADAFRSRLINRRNMGTPLFRMGNNEDKRREE